MISLPWSVVTALRLEPVGPIDPMVFGLTYRGAGFEESYVWNGEGYDYSRRDTEAVYTIIDLPRARQTRDLLGSMMYDPRPIQGPFKPEKHPFYIAFCNLHSEVSR